MSGRALRIGVGAAGLGGLALLVVIVTSFDLNRLGDLLLTIGWGIAAVTAVHLLSLAISALAWHTVANQVWRGSWLIFVWARLTREAVSSILPVAHVGGDIVGARILTFHGATATQASASLLVDLTLEFLTQIAFTAIGLGCLLQVRSAETMRWSLVALAVAVPAAAALVLAQRWGLARLFERGLERLAERFGLPALGSLANLHETILAIYRQRPAIAAASCWHLAGWGLGAVEVWLTLRFLGAHTGLIPALIIESLGQAVRAAAFVVPGALGVQEAGFLLLGTIFGLAPETGLSISLVRRIRELALGLPAILIWQVVENRRLLHATGERRRP
jgi:putative membrane protein